MKQNTISSLGIDISKHYLDVYHLPSHHVSRYENNLQGIDSLVSWIKINSLDFLVFEPSGGYEKLLRKCLQAYSVDFAMINAGQIRHFAKAKGLLAKTDKIDAMVLADYGIKMQPKSFSEVNQGTQELKEWLSARRKTVNNLKLESQRLEHKPCTEIKDMIHQTIEHYHLQLRKIEEKIQVLVKSSPSFSSQQKCLMQEKGVGKIVSATLIAELPELGKCSHQQIAALAGVAPHNHDSGNLKGYRSIKGGREVVRSVLYMAVISAIRSNEKIRVFYHRLRENGKKAKVALTACMRKLLIILNAILRNAYADKTIDD